MSFSILNNSAVMRGNNLIARAGQDYARSLERLSSGKKINRASDGPADVIAIENFNSREVLARKSIEGLQRQSIFLAAREGAESALSEPLNELLSLVVQAANRGALSADEKQALQRSADDLIGLVDHLGQTQQFNGQQILSGVNRTSVGLVPVDAAKAATGVGRMSALGVPSYSLANLAGGGELNLVDGDLEKAQEVVEAALSQFAVSRADIGARQKAIDSEISTAQIELENLAAARSQIQDTDYAEETSRLVRAQVLQDAATYMRQIALSHQADTILQLMKGAVPGGGVKSAA